MYRSNGSYRSNSNINKISDKELLDFAVLTKYLRYMLLVYSTNTMNMLGVSKKISKMIGKISDDFDLYKCQVEDHLWIRLEDMKDRNVFNKKKQEVFFGESDINVKLIDKFIKDISEQ
jgi:hypothetical protein